MADSKLIWASTPAADGGTFYAAPLGTTLPATGVAALDPAFVDHGWLGEDGFLNGIKKDITKHKAWGGEVVKITLDNYEETFKLTLMESSPTVLASVFGPENVHITSTSGHRQITVNHSPLMLGRRSFVARMVEGTKTKLIVIPEGQVSEVADIQNVHSKPLVFEITLDCFRPSNPTTGNEKAVNEHIDEPDVTSGS